MLGPMYDGLVVVDKPAGFTSHDVVAKLRKAYGQKRVGHAGTLDPGATGVLLVGLGRVTRLLRFLQETTKEYRGTIGFGVATDTLDADGSILERRAMPVSETAVREAKARFVGDIRQVPPMVSALQVGGRRLHELARAGEEVEREARPVRIDRFELEAFEPGPFPRATVLVECSSGTYVRSLAADLGAALGGPAHLAELRRLRVGPFTIEEARSLPVVEADPPAAVLAPVEAMRGLERATVDEKSARAVAHGSVFPCVALAVDGPGPYAVVDDAGTLLAVYERRGAALKPAVVLASADAP
jgi:tRNA pseudouridine55 synthase